MQLTEINTIWKQLNEMTMIKPNVLYGKIKQIDLGHCLSRYLHLLSDALNLLSIIAVIYNILLNRKKV